MKSPRYEMTLMMMRSATFESLENCVDMQTIIVNSRSGIIERKHSDCGEGSTVIASVVVDAIVVDAKTVARLLCHPL